VVDQGDGTMLRTGGAPEREARIMSHARRHGFPVPEVREVRDDALVLERIDGPTMTQDLVRRAWLARRHVDALVDLHTRLHAISFEQRSLVHFDLHPDNVLLSAQGPVVIDWTNARAGEPDDDLAMTWLILATSGGLPGRVLAHLFGSRVGRSALARGLPGARAFRLADPNVTDAERARVRRAAP
jgi:serine/threonine protein kinase